MGARNIFSVLRSLVGLGCLTLCQQMHPLFRTRTASASMDNAKWPLIPPPTSARESRLGHRGHASLALDAAHAR